MHSLAPLETSRVGETHQGAHDLAHPLHPRHHLHHCRPHDCQTLRDRHGLRHHPHGCPRVLSLCLLEEQAPDHTQTFK